MTIGTPVRSLCLSNCLSEVLGIVSETNTMTPLGALSGFGLAAGIEQFR